MSRPCRYLYNTNTHSLIHSLNLTLLSGFGVTCPWMNNPALSKMPNGAISDLILLRLRNSLSSKRQTWRYMELIGYARSWGCQSCPWLVSGIWLSESPSFLSASDRPERSFVDSISMLEVRLLRFLRSWKWLYQSVI